MAKAERAIDPMEFTSIARTKEFIDSLPETVRTCPDHGEPVVIRESEISVYQDAGPPFGKAAFTACCESAMKRVIDAIALASLRS